MYDSCALLSVQPVHYLHFFPFHRAFRQQESYDPSFLQAWQCNSHIPSENYYVHDNPNLSVHLSLHLTIQNNVTDYPDALNHRYQPLILHTALLYLPKK